MTMGHRERVLKALNHEEPDRVPFDLGGAAGSSVHIDKYEELKVHFGVEEQTTLGNRWVQSVVVHEQILQALDIDFRYLSTGPSNSKPEIEVGDDGYRDEFGLLRRMPPGSRYYDVVEFPLSGLISVRDIVNYPWPDPTDPGYTRGLRDRALALRESTDCAIVLQLASPFVHTTQFLRGFEDWFMDLAGDPALASALFEATVEVSSVRAAEALKVVGDLVDVVVMADDLGFQTTPIVSPEMYRRLFKPWHKKYFDAVKAHTSAYISFHCCGAISKLLDDLIDIGVDAVNPVQVAATGMDSASLASEFGDRLSFWGAIDTQDVLPNGSVGDVRAEVKRRFGDLAPSGGYVFSAVHNIQPDVPLENILAMFEAAKDYGGYPIDQTG
ncbi:MAG: uroporphyrinogen decarboxylase family protein [Dehalococcoidia bacterium]|jgi:uroporphyrinogen decarboxylase|nr:uroporphyrinogen decarboxylase family protein [Dehalococcoidia bacterium]MDP7262594.1 uroporphyrinogen decarboxylase family protein [Dehalococcoidia bacterium]|tara:strand:+ start:705 stop:1856 length:1152 start_codon:yes stop_codon:yes gene_type:complete